MKHASPATIERLTKLLEQVRAVPGLKEKKPGVYYRRSRAFLHFHEDEGRVFADVRLSGTEFSRLPCSTEREQALLIKAIRKSQPAHTGAKGSR